MDGVEDDPESIPSSVQNLLAYISKPRILFIGHHYGVVTIEISVTFSEYERQSVKIVGR
jgi:hypothetical protein